MRILFATFLAAFCALSADADAQDRTSDQLVIRTYEIGDLLLNIHDRPYADLPSTPTTNPTLAGGMGGGGGGGFGGAPRVPGVVTGSAFATPINMTVTPDTLIDAIVTAADHGSWSENGTGPGQIMLVGSALVVAQKQAVHEQIEALLDALRQGTGNRGTVRVDARWLLLTSDELDQLTATENAGVDRGVLERLTRKPTSIRGITNCFGGQLVYLVSGTRRNVVQSYIPVVGSVDDTRFDAPQVARRSGPSLLLASQRDVVATSRGVGYQPIVSTPNFGALLTIRPTVTPGDDRVTVDLKSTITVPSGAAVAQVADSAFAAGSPAVDRVAIETQEFATTLRIPLGKPFLVGGMTYAPMQQATRGVGNGQPREGEQPQLYLVLEVR